MAITDLVDVVAVEVHDPPTLAIFEPDAIRRHEGVQARRRERLVQEVPRIVVQNVTRGGMHVFLLERAAQRRGVDVPLGGGVRQCIGLELARRARVVHLTTAGNTS